MPTISANVRHLCGKF